MKLDPFSGGYGPYPPCFRWHIRRGEAAACAKGFP